jgi:hypothetical protein
MKAMSLIQMTCIETGSGTLIGLAKTFTEAVIGYLILSKSGVFLNINTQEKMEELSS